jgi:hypothetical protein
MKRVTRKVYRRLYQFREALTARFTEQEYACVAQVLNPAELCLFSRMPLFDQRHCFEVYRTLLRGGHDDPHLLRAALLHDCGKVDDDGRPIPLLYYGLFVVVKALAPRLYWRAARHGRGVLRPFAVHAEHDLRSAGMAAAAGSSPETVQILLAYAHDDKTPLMRALSWADNQN